MQYHASCAAKGDAGVLLIGPSGSGKSDLVLRLLDHGYTLVADDIVNVTEGVASPPRLLAGMLEVRGLGILRLAYTPAARLVLAVELARSERLPEPEWFDDLPLVRIDPEQHSAPARVTAALRCVLGELSVVAGALL